MIEAQALAADVEFFAALLALSLLAFAFTLGYLAGAARTERRLRTPRLVPLSIGDVAKLL